MGIAQTLRYLRRNAVSAVTSARLTETTKLLMAIFDIYREHVENLGFFRHIPRTCRKFGLFSTYTENMSKIWAFFDIYREHVENLGFFRHIMLHRAYSLNTRLVDG